MNIIKILKRKRNISVVRKRMEFLGRIFDTIDAGFIKNKISQKDRMDFWLRFIGNQSYRKEFIEKTINGLKDGH